LALLFGCGDSCREYSKYSCKELEQATYNAYFYFPSAGREYFLGMAQGLQQCGAMAHSYAASKNLSSNDGWGYVCCLKTEKSACEEKHR
jgi:hypothetical protein